MIHVSPTPQAPGLVDIRLKGYLGDKFVAYRDICRALGARYVPSESCNRIVASEFPKLLEEFKKASLPVTIDEKILDAVKAELSAAKEVVNQGKATLNRALDSLEGRKLFLYNYQKLGIEWLGSRRKALLCDEMGLGKTIQALLALPEKRPVLVVLPSAIRSGWEAEAKLWRRDYKVGVIRTKDEFRFPRAGEILLVTYGMLPFATQADVMKLKPPTNLCLLADEAHALKNKSAQRTKKFVFLTKHALSTQGLVWLLTGTPLLNHPLELWNLLQVVDLVGESFGSWYQFVRLFHGRQGQWGYEWGKPKEEVPDILRKVSLHRRREQVLEDLPGKTRKDILVEDLDKATKKICDEVWALIKKEGIDLEDVEAEVKTTKIQGAAFERMSEARAALAVAKIPTLLELVEEYEEAEEPLIVFSAHRAPIQALSTRKGWGLVMGDTSADERGRIVREFQEGKLKGIAGTIGALGVGVTLTRAHHVLMVDLAWTPALNSQAEDRVCRIGQKAKGVFITRLVARHALDERVMELLTKKQEIIERSVEASAREKDFQVEALPEKKILDNSEATFEALEKAAKEGKAIEEEERKKKEAEAAQMAKELGSSWDGRTLKVRGKFRSAANAEEEWAGEAILFLADSDPDRAQLDNLVGFNKLDNEFGHSLASSLRKYGILSNKQWAAAVKMAYRYHRQTKHLRKAGVTNG